MDPDKGYVIYSTNTPRGACQGIGNHLLIFNASYSYCIDNRLPFVIDEDAHPIFRNMTIPKVKHLTSEHYTIEHLSDIQLNGLPFQIHSPEGSEDTNGASFMRYAHNIPKIIEALNIPSIDIDGCVMHYRRFREAPQANIGLPYYLNALKHIKSRNIYIISGYDNYDIDSSITRRNVAYLIEKLSNIYPDKRFIDIHTVSEYKRNEPTDECALHWYLCVNAPEMIAANSTFSLSAAIFRCDKRTVVPKYVNNYRNFNVDEYMNILSDVRFVTRNMIVSAWYNIDDNPDASNKRQGAISTFFERINNADIIIFTDEPDAFKERNVDWLSHVRLINVPFESLYGYQFKEFYERNLIINSGHKGRGANWKMMALWNSKLWMVLQASSLLNKQYDKISWLDLGVYKNDTIVQKDIFPVFEKHMLNRSLWYSLNTFHKTLNSLYDGPVEGGFQLYPNHEHVQLAYMLFDVTLKECIKTNILVGTDEEIMRLMLSLTGDFLMIGIDKSLGKRGYCRFIYDFSDSTHDFIKMIYPDIPKQKPDVDISFLHYWMERHKQPINWDHTRDVW